MRLLKRPDPDDQRGAARRAFDEANVALDELRLDDAEAGFRRALDLGGGTPSLWFNLGLVYKFRHEWVKAVDANRRCLEMKPRHHEATWNLAMAATALRDWA